MGHVQKGNKTIWKVVTPENVSFSLKSWKIPNLLSVTAWMPMTGFYIPSQREGKDKTEANTFSNMFQNELIMH